MDWTMKEYKDANHNPVVIVILAVEDDGEPSVTSYRRVILDIAS